MKHIVRDLEASRWRRRLVSTAILNVAWSVVAAQTTSPTFPFGFGPFELLIGGR